MVVTAEGRDFSQNTQAGMQSCKCRIAIGGWIDRLDRRFSHHCPVRMLATDG